MRALSCSSSALQWTPLGFRTTDPKTFDDISKERFQGTVLKTISKSPQIYQITKDGVKGDPDEKVGAPPPHGPRPSHFPPPGRDWTNGVSVATNAA